MYKGPDTKYDGREICYGYNENMMVIYDMTNKKAPAIISKSTYNGGVYCHQGWASHALRASFSTRLTF